MHKVMIFFLACTAAALLHSPRALADASGPIDTIEVIETPISNPDVINRELGRQANVLAASEAAERIAAATVRDLDFWLRGHTSIPIASNR